MPAVSTRLSSGILVISFARPVTVPIDRLTSTLSAYVAAARVDPDGKAMRLALSRPVKINTMEAGERYFVDLLPESWKQGPPSLPQDVIDELNAKAKEAERLRREADARIARAKPKPIEIRAARATDLHAPDLRLGDPVPVRLERAANEVTATFDAPLHADIRDLKAELPDRIESIEANEKDSRLSITLAVADGSDVRAFWDSGSYVIDIAGGSGRPAAPATGLPQDLATALAPDAALGNGVTTLEASKSARSRRPATDGPAGAVPAAG